MPAPMPGMPTPVVISHGSMSAATTLTLPLTEAPCGVSATVPSNPALKSSPARLKLVTRPPPSVPFAETSVVCLAEHAERQRRQAVERQQRGGIGIPGAEGQRHWRLEKPIDRPFARQRSRKGRAACLALRADRQPCRAVAIVGRARHQIDARILEQLGIGRGSACQLLQQRHCRDSAASRQSISGVRSTATTDGIELAGRARRENP